MNDHTGASAILAGQSGMGVEARASGVEAAVFAGSTTSRGIISQSKLAQIQLTPGGQTTHPKAGEAGDLFVDKSARLWFCKVSGSPATWVKLA